MDRALCPAPTHSMCRRTLPLTSLVDSRNLVQPSRSLQQLARTAPVGRPYQPIALHQVDQVRGAPVANPQPPLQQRRARLPKLEDQPDGIVEHHVVLFRVRVRTVAGRSLIARRLKESFNVLGLALVLP